MADLIRLVSKATSSFLELKTISVDNWTFKCHYKASVVLAIFCSVIVTSRQFFGSPIKCDVGTIDSVSEDVVEAYCWMYAHFNIPPNYHGACSGKDQASDVGYIMYNSFYQWVPIYLIFLAVLFYLPRCLWLMMEGGLMKFFGKGTTCRIIQDPEEKRDALVDFFSKNIHNKYNIYYFGFIFCEFLNLLVVLISFFLTHKFLNNRFFFYGFKVVHYYMLPPEEQQRYVTNPMCYTFPRIASCDYYRFGSGGIESKFNVLCILSLNVINDKVFLILWFWMFILIFLGVSRLIFRVVQINSARLRFYMFQIRLHRYFKRNANMDKVEYFVTKCSRGDWFVLYQLSKNINRPFFMDFLNTLVRRVDPDKPADQSGDDVMDLMLQPTYYSEEKNDRIAPKAKQEDDDDDS